MLFGCYLVDLALIMHNDMEEDLRPLYNLYYIRIVIKIPIKLKYSINTKYIYVYN